MASSNTLRPCCDQHKLVLCVGWLCVDIINIVEEFPQEDSDTRVYDSYWQRGGNASNTSTVLSVLGRPCELMTTIGKNTREYRFLMEDLQKHNINTDHVVFTDHNECPQATVIVSRESGSRTILYTLRDIPEITEENMVPVLHKADRYSWIHFEGRPNVNPIYNMLSKIDILPNKREIITSVELEHISVRNIDLFLDKADYVFISKDFASQKGHKDKISSVKYFSAGIRDGATVVCAWGEDGASAMKKGEDIVSVPAVKLEKVVDTLGAGDTFIASFINATLAGLSLQQCLEFSCKIAGAKCAMRGYDGLSKFKRHEEG